MIKKLTHEQETLLLRSREEALAIGRDSSPVDRQAVESVFCSFYKRLCLPRPQFFYPSSPVSAADKVFHPASGPTLEHGFTGIWITIAANIRIGIASSVWARIATSIRDATSTSIWDNIAVNIQAGFWANIAAPGSKGVSPLPTYYWGQHDISWISYYKYYFDAGLLPPDYNAEIVGKWFILSQSAGWCYAFEKVVIVCEKPQISLNSSGQLHKDGSMALQYSDGWGIYMLNGVHVPRWLAETKDTDIDPTRIHEIDNAEIRREFVRKVGLERILHKLGGEELDSKTVPLRTPLAEQWLCRYKVMRLRFGEAVRHVLVMDNPSLFGTYHVEYVPNACNTVDQAMNFRLNRDEKDIDEIRGDHWYLHGDVILKPQVCVKQKRWPALIA